MMVLKDRFIIVHDGQFVTTVDEELVVTSRVVHIVDHRCNESSQDLQVCEDTLDCMVEELGNHSTNLHVHEIRQQNNAKQLHFFNDM